MIGVSAIAVDPQGSAYITGGAGTLWPTTPAAYATQIPGAQPYRGVFVTKLSPDGSNLSYSTFLGNGGGTGIVLDSNLDAIITGAADTATFPVTSNAYLPTMKDCCAFLSKISPDGSQLVYSTFLGSNSGSGLLSAMGIGLGSQWKYLAVRFNYRFPTFTVESASICSFYLRKHWICLRVRCHRHDAKVLDVLRRKFTWSQWDRHRPYRQGAYRRYNRHRHIHNSRRVSGHGDRCSSVCSIHLWIRRADRPSKGLSCGLLRPL